MKYYYNDPLAAAWMAKHFGMRFCDRTGLSVSADPALWYMAERHYQASSLFITAADEGNLEPLAGDIVVRKVDGYQLADAVTEIDDEGQLYTASLDVRRQWIGPKLGSRIIQRKGVAFMWPEEKI